MQISKSAYSRLVSKPMTIGAEKTAVSAERHILKKTARAEERLVAREGMAFNLDALSKAGQTMARGGLTRASRALEKHGGRPGSVFPKATGNPVTKNTQGRYHLDDILTHPGSVVQYRNHPKFGDIIDIRISGQQGIRYYQNGEFIGFLEP
jgi:hypothetical protein